MIIQRIAEMLRMSNTDAPPFPPTELFNEGWLLRLVLDAFSSQKIEKHPLCFSVGARWFSEGLLPSAFLPRYRGDPLGESWTHADGIIGHFMVGGGGRADISLRHDTGHFVALEAKMFSRLSPGVTHARYFDQAARTVACIAEALRRAALSPGKLSTVGFCVLAPETQISTGVFEKEMSSESIRRKVEKRVGEYKGERDKWLSESFHPTLEHIQIGCMSWERILNDLEGLDPQSFSEIKAFYGRCLELNAPN